MILRVSDIHDKYVLQFVFKNAPENRG